MNTAADTIRVLHVDDDPAFAEMVATFLERESDAFAVETATDAAEGRARICEGGIDCVVSDYDMPGRNGIEFLRAVRAERSDLPFVLFTGKGSEEIASEAITAGVTDYLQKGSGTDQYSLLANRIRNAVDQVRAERERERMRERMELALAETDSIIYEIDLESGAISRHGAVESFYPVDTDRIPTRDDFTEHVVHPDDRDRFEAFFERIGTAENGLDTIDYRTNPETGTVRWLRGHAYHDGDDRIIGLVQDVTDRKERQRAIERHNERLEEFTSVVSHDLRNPLNVARGRLELAREGEDPEHFEAVERAHDRMEALIIDLLTLAREGETSAALTDVALDDLIEACWENVETAAATLALEPDGRTEVRLRADERRLRRLLENLVRNSVEHGGEAVTVRVGGLPDGDGFYVEDDGPGIPPDRREDAFSAGYSTNPDGTGFGLSIVQGIVETHGWEIRVVEGDGGGARFEVTGVELVAG
ncbi:His Kinase A (phospho-acceptor) domain-containing protein [Halorubrum aquaticum]|uniref:histidine kinase n=1 Tax=Halorubrum aquaticum TaxID=387340 RepID=A0A1I3BXJ3_9EURY|nr:response regulator [Halorubrum aquaticum]SFH66659.1 His Kinase A (phospho-acceptor) domain-containing protein [Halorubrum aquaticum]